MLLLSFFYKLRNIVPSAILRDVYFALVHSKIVYGIELHVYANTCQSNLDKLIILNNKLLRILQKKPFRTHRSDLYIEYNSLPINHLFSQHILLLMYKCNQAYTKQLLPSLFQNYMFPNKNIHAHDTRTKNLLHLTQVNSSFGSRAINVLGAKLWNTLPASISNATSFFPHLRL